MRSRGDRATAARYERGPVLPGRAVARKANSPGFSPLGHRAKRETVCWSACSARKRFADVERWFREIRQAAAGPRRAGNCGSRCGELVARGVPGGRRGAADRRRDRRGSTGLGMAGRRSRPAGRRRPPRWPGSSTRRRGKPESWRMRKLRRPGSHSARASSSGPFPLTRVLAELGGSTEQRQSWADELAGGASGRTGARRTSGRSEGGRRIRGGTAGVRRGPWSRWRALGTDWFRGARNYRMLLSRCGSVPPSCGTRQASLAAVGRGSRAAAS